MTTKDQAELARLAAHMSHKMRGYDIDDVERVPGERWVTMGNALIRAGHGLTLAEKRLVMIAVSKLDSTRRIKPGDVLRTKISADEYAETFSVDLDTAYDQLQSAAKNLYKRSITFFEPAHRRDGRPLPPTIVHMRWVGLVKYQKGEGWVELSWWPDLLPHLIGLQKHFTSYQLQQASALRSIYSWRLLELLTRFENTGWAEYDIDDFKTSMDAPASLSDFGQVKRRIIEPAVKELNEKDGWIIQWRPIKSGRKVKAIRFDFMRDPQLRLSV